MTAEADMTVCFDCDRPMPYSGGNARKRTFYLPWRVYGTTVVGDVLVCDACLDGYRKRNHDAALEIRAEMRQQRAVHT